MKNLLISLSLVGVILTSPAVVAAQSVASPAATTKTAVTDKRVTNLQTRGAAEIDRRLTSLNSWLGRINANPNLSPTAKTNLAGTIQAEVTSLTALKAKIEADTELVTLRADVKSITDSYRVYALVLPQTALTVTANRVEMTAAKMATISAQLETELEGNTSKPAQTALTSLKAKVASALAAATKVQTAVLALVPQGYPGNRSTLTTSRNQLQTAIRDLRNARTDIKTIMDVLKTSAPASGSASASSSAKPAGL